jgi:hypothetical protein
MMIHSWITLTRSSFDLRHIQGRKSIAKNRIAHERIVLHEAASFIEENTQVLWYQKDS